MTTKTKRTFYTLGAAALLLVAGPALADAGSRRDCDARCHCAQMAAAGHGATRDAPAQTASAGDREAEFLQEVWSAP